MRASFVLTVMTFLLAAGAARAQDLTSNDMDTNQLNRRFDNLRIIERFGTSYITMRETLFRPLPYEGTEYAKVPKKARSDFEKGNAAMQRGDYSKAKAEYESIPRGFI